MAIIVAKRVGIPSLSSDFKVGVRLLKQIFLQAQVAQQQQQESSFSTSNSAVTSSTVSSSSPVTSLTSVPPLNGMVGPPQPPPGHPTHPHFPPHPPGLPHPAHPPHPHFHPHLGMEPPRPRFLFKMPRVVPNQKEKYESDDLMKRHSREGEVWLFVFCIVACK